MDDDVEPGKHIAICGSGIAGLSAAWILSQNPANTVTIFEYRDTLGMDADSINLQLKPAPGQPVGSKGKTVRVDAPPRAFSAGYYPTLMSMYERAGVEIAPMDWSLCAFVDGGDGDGDGHEHQQPPQHVLWHGRRWSDRSVISNTMRFGARLLAELVVKGPCYVRRSARVLVDWARFYWWDMPRALRAAEADPAGAGAALRRQRFGDFLGGSGGCPKGRYSRDFELGILLPLLSMVPLTSLRSTTTQRSRFYSDYNTFAM